MSGEAQKLTDHDQIRAWAEDRGGRPAVVEDTGDDGSGDGVLRFEFEASDDALKTVSWETFFETFEQKNLALLVQEETADGSTSRFFKFVER